MSDPARIQTIELALADYLRRWPEEAETVSRIRELLGGWPQCLERTHTPGHLTASAWVVDPTGTEVVLTHHRKLDIWVQLGGHADGDPDLPAVARREVLEESGLEDVQEIADPWWIFDADVHPIPAYRQTPAHYHYDIRFAFRAIRREELVISDESHDVQWVALADLEGYTREASMLRMARKWQELRPALLTGRDSVYPAP